MKKIIALAAKKQYKLSFCDKSGNWKGDHYRGGYIIIHFPGGSKERNSVKAAIDFLK
jgi:hypothetical protein